MMDRSDALSFLETQEAQNLIGILGNNLSVLIAFIDRNLQIVYVNQAFESIFERPIAEVTGSPLLDHVPPEYKDRLQDSIDKVLIGHPTTFETALSPRDSNKTVHLEGTFRPFFDENELQQGFFVIANDFTALDEAESQRAETQAFLRTIIHSSPNSVITINIDGKIISFSKKAEEVFGFTQNEVLYKNINVLMPEPDHSQHNEYIEHYLSTGEHRIIGIPRIVTARKKSGETFPVRLFVNQFDDGEPFFVGFLEDVSKEMDAQRRLSETQSKLEQFGRVSLLGEFAGAIAHEVGQPLTAASSFAEAAALILRSHNPDAEERVRDILSDVTAQIQRASAIIQTMKEMIRNHQPEYAVHDVNKVVNEISRIALAGAEQKGIQVTKEFDETAGQIEVDKVQIQQVLTNLIRNGMDAMNETDKRELTIKTRRKDDEVEIIVANSGPSIPDDVSQHMFEPFYTTKHDGLGIGLSLSKAIVDAHQGELAYKRNHDDRTEFTVRLRAHNSEQ